MGNVISFKISYNAIVTVEGLGALIFHKILTQSVAMKAVTHMHS